MRSVLVGILLATAWIQGHARLRNPPEVSPVVDKLSRDTTDAKIAALKTKATAAATRARSAAAQAATAKIQTQQLEMQNEMKKPELEDALAMAQEAAKNAVEASKEAVAALTETKAIAKTAIAEAKRLAVSEVKSELNAAYHRLDEWRNKVLSNPWEQAQKAGKLAAVPYNNMIKTFYGRLGAYQDVAGGMMSKANSLAAGAQKMAASAQGKMDGGDPIGANSDFALAAAMRSNSAKYAGAANALHAEANGMNQMISQYVAAGHLAAWHAAYKADPDALPPPPVNPNFAFTPPPTVLLQEKEGAAGIEKAVKKQKGHSWEVMIAEAEAEGAEEVEKKEEKQISRHP